MTDKHMPAATDAYMRLITLFDQDATAGSFLSEDGEGGFVAGVYRMAREIERLRALSPENHVDLREAAWLLIKDLDRSLVGSRDIAVIHATNTSVKRLRILLEKLDRETPSPEPRAAVTHPMIKFEEVEDAMTHAFFNTKSAASADGLHIVNMNVTVFLREMFEAAHSLADAFDQAKSFADRSAVNARAARKWEAPHE